MGASRLGALLHSRAFRADPAHPGAQYYYIWHVSERRGPLVGWQERQRLGVPRTDDPEHLADYHGQSGLLLSSLRDFERARSSVEQAEAAAPGRAYTHVEWSHLYLAQDRYQDALEVARRGLAANGGYVPVVLSAAQCLLLLSQDDAALDLLRAAQVDAEDSDIVSFLFPLLLKRQLLDEAEAAAARFDALTPLKDQPARNTLARMRADLAIRRGDYRSAVTHVEQVDHPWDTAVGRNLRAFLRDAADRQPRRVEHSVAFVRQHYRTCAPATLSAISAFWRRPAEHLAVAEEICYDGTPAHSERRWAEEHGWRVREFRVDWASATALLDRGAPFTLTISDATTGHLQAVIGYDEATGVLLVRDPLAPGTTEVLANELLSQQRIMGPRGMAMVPVDEARLLDGLDLPDAERYDRYYAMQMALEAHDRDRAVESYRQLAASDAGHRLTLTARWVLARYDSNPHESLAAVDALLGIDSDNALLQLARLQNLRQVGQRDERLRWLHDVCERPGADPMLRLEYAVELAQDDRRLAEAAWHLRRAMRRRPMEPYAVFQLGELLWRMGRRPDAIELYRFAACLDDTNERYAQRYFTACRWERQAGRGLALLEARVEHLGERSGMPAMTLVEALEWLDRVDDALAVLERAVDRCPDDGELRLFAAGRLTRHGRPEAARVHREAAAGRVKRTAWLADVARNARLRGDRAEALGSWREIVRLQPLDLEAHNMIALLLTETSTRFEAVEHLQTVCEAFPHHAGLCRLLYDWTTGDAAVERERVLRRLVQIDPADAWAKRELALNLHQQARLEEALAMAEEALALEANASAGHGVLGHVLRSLGRPAEAAERYREAIRRSADFPPAIHGLLDVAGDSMSGRLEALAFVQAQLREQAVSGDGLLAFREAARGVLTPDELLEALRRVHEQRPDSWQAWSALGRHLSDMGRTDEALEVARQGTERFPRIPRLWLDLSRVHQARLELERQVEALDRCRELNPDWTDATMELCSAWERAGRQEDCIRLLEGAIRRTPLDSDLRARLASLLHRRGDVDRAVEALREVLRVNPDYPWAWQALAEWSEARGQRTAALDLARAYAESRPGESHPWMHLAELNLARGHPDAALEAVERALAINPRLVDAYDQKARALVMLRRFRDAEAACRPEALGDPPPIPLQGRAAWVDAERGDLTAAMRRMEAALQLQPDYQWGWRQLVEWRSQQGLLGKALEAAERLAWLEPAEMVPLGWIGDLKHRLKDRRGAKAAFERAMRLEPSYLFAGFRFLDIQRGEEDFAGARRTLEILRLHASRDRVLLAELEIHIAQSHLDESLALVRQLCGDRSFDGEVLARAIEAMVEKQWGRKVERVLKEVLAGSGWHDLTPTLWARVRVRRGRLGGVLRYRWLAAMDAPGKAAINEFLGEIGVRGQATAGNPDLAANLSWHLRWIRVWCRRWRADDGYWGQVGYALLCCGRRRGVIRWMRDWRTRPNAPNWALQNLLVALLMRRRDRAAREVLHHVMTRPASPVDEVTPLLRLWCSVAACLEQDLGTARRLLHETPKDVVREGDQLLREFAETLVDVLSEPGDRRSLTPVRRDIIARADSRDTGRATRRLVLLGAYRMARHTRDLRLTVETWLGVHGRPWQVVVALAIVVALLAL